MSEPRARRPQVPHGSVHYVFSGKAEIVRAVIAADTESAVQIFSTVTVGGGSVREVWPGRSPPSSTGWSPTRRPSWCSRS